PYVAGEPAGRFVFGETDYSLSSGWAPLRWVRSEGVKFIEAPKPELYDLHADPGELNNKSESGSASVSELQILLPERKEATAQALPDPKDKIDEQNLLHQAMLASDDNRPADARAALE